MKLPRNSFIWCVLIVFNAVDIHLADAKFATGTEAGRWPLFWHTNPVSSNLEAGETPPFQG